MTKHNRHIAALALALAAATGAGSALADDITVDTNPYSASRSRAEVQAELGAFKRAGNSPWSTQHDPLRGFASGKTRAQVTAEFMAAREQSAAMASEDSGAAYMARHQPAGAAATQLAGQPARAQ